MRVRGWAVAAVVVAGTGIAGAGVASAQAEPTTATTATTATTPTTTQPGSVTITLSPEQVAKICGQRVPRIEERITKLTERVTGDASVRGSAAWLRDRAAKERAAGHEVVAKGLDERADKRAGRAPELDKLKQRVADFSAKYCGGTR